MILYLNKSRNWLVRAVKQSLIVLKFMKINIARTDSMLFLKNFDTLFWCIKF
jgi:hypothetical protein